MRGLDGEQVAAHLRIPRFIQFPEIRDQLPAQFPMLDNERSFLGDALDPRLF